MSSTNRLICRLLVVVGNSLALIGCVGLILGSIGFVRVDVFAIGISSGIRVIASVAIAGCLLSAIGYGIVDYLDE